VKKTKSVSVSILKLNSENNRENNNNLYARDIIKC